MTREEALKALAFAGATWFGNSKQHFAFSAYDRLNGWYKLADKWKTEAEEEWIEAEEVLNRLVELGCKPADLQEALKTIEFPFYDDPKQQIEADFQPNAVAEMNELLKAFDGDYTTTYKSFCATPVIRTSSSGTISDGSLRPRDDLVRIC